MDIIGYLAAALIGLSLGLIGGGGSILTVPVMVYLFGMQPLLATSYSLFVVGSTSLVGAFRNYRKGLVNIKAAISFALSSILTVFLVRKFVVPLIPPVLATIGNYKLTSSFLIMILLAMLMLISAFGMIRGRDRQKFEYVDDVDVQISRLIFYGIIIGLVTGLTGAGGGFLLIPALVLIIRLPMDEAIGTSLLVIAMNSLTGFAGDIGRFQFDWPFLAKITAIAIAGVLAGSWLANKIKPGLLKKSFGWFVLAMAIYIIIRETINK